MPATTPCSPETEPTADPAPELTDGFYRRLVESVTDETNRATKDEESVEDTVCDALVSLRTGEHTARTHHVNERGGDGAIDVENEVSLW